jgi:hypothetical protein
MVVRMISRNITIPHHPLHAGGGGAWGGGWGIVMFSEITLTTIFILNSLHELKVYVFFWPLTYGHLPHSIRWRHTPAPQTSLFSEDGATLVVICRFPGDA